MSNIVAISATASFWQGADRLRLSANYIRSIEGAGLVPVAVPPLTDPGRAAEIMNVAGGLLLTGGEDVDPSRYGEVNHASVSGTNPMRDATEVALLLAARAQQRPVLAICRGIQLINVALGGTLIQDLASQRPSNVQHDQPHEREERTHGVTIPAGSRLAAATGTTVMAVNSYHHQAIARLAPGLEVTATASDDVIEAAEVQDSHWWVLAVQWHPEDLIADVRAWDRGIFRAFAAEVARGALDRSVRPPPHLVPHLAHDALR
ncbi:MAG TPA: gamma-glutamyl-gamma-aminobutyrate hydrolase family protein [Gemmatimonadaceae bacterium]|nr:gamma-glutamyl-gamma-aminobutyrate hydrolase family protein [Gemmatimonadaceae bacterium]